MESPQQARMRQYLQLVATGPELSKSLDKGQAKDAMDMILGGDIDAVRAALFLIALRMKRETDDENRGVFDSLMENLKTSVTKSEHIVSIADPFNGYLRSLPATPFLPAVFAACGLPAYIHGLHSAGPKYGITAHMVLKSAGMNVDISVEEAASNIDNKALGWTYLDQRQYSEQLHNLVALRDTMVKRCCLSTLEVILKPLSGSISTSLMTGFVHKAYPPVYHSLARQAGFDSAAIIRGVEGGCVPSLSQVSRYFGYHFGYDNDEALSLHKLSPKEIGIDQRDRAALVADSYQRLIEQTAFGNTDVLNEVVNDTVKLGMAALHDEPGPMKDSLIYSAAIGLKQFGKAHSMIDAAKKVREVLANGVALERFNAVLTQ